jgi:CRISPR/Cas system CSM-associated protein Csm3 (group 7 of RAMP superfamily)
MKNNRTYQFVGNIRTLEPLSVVLKGASTGRGHKMPRNGELGYFPASSIRGALRHECHKLINEELKAKNDGSTSLDLAQMLMLAQGYFVNKSDMEAIGKEAKATSSPVDAGLAIREINPMISIFGRWGLAGKLGVGSAYTSRTDDVGMIHGGARTVLFERSPELLDDLSTGDVDRFYAFMEAQSLTSVDVGEIKKERMAQLKQLKTATNEQKEQINKEIKKLDAQIAERKDSETEAVESLRRPLDGVEAILPGVDLKHRMSLNNASMVELGLFLITLAKFARNPQLGGHVNHNFGKVAAEWDIKAFMNDSDFMQKTIGKVVINEDGFAIEGDELKQELFDALAQWDAAVKSDKLDFGKYI